METLLYTYGQLVDKDFDFFRNLPITFIYEKAGYPSITCCHGSPASSRELLQLNEDPVKQWLEKIDTDYMICAHTHYPGEMTYKTNITLIQAVLEYPLMMPDMHSACC